MKASLSKTTLKATLVDWIWDSGGPTHWSTAQLISTSPPAAGHSVCGRASSTFTCYRSDFSSLLFCSLFGDGHEQVSVKLVVRHPIPNFCPSPNFWKSVWGSLLHSETLCHFHSFSVEHILLVCQTADDLTRLIELSWAWGLRAWPSYWSK